MSSTSELKNLTSRHQQLARLLVGGYSQTEISRTLDLHKSTVCRLVKQPLIATEVNRIKELADVSTATSVPGMPDKISERATRSIQVLMGILDDERNEPAIIKVKALVAQDLLSRAGYGQVKRIDIRQETAVAHFTSEDLAELTARANSVDTSYLEG